MNDTFTRRACLALALAIVAPGLAACGSGGAGAAANGPTTAPAQESPKYQLLVNGRHGGTLTVFDHADFVHLDPGQAYTSLDYEITSATQRTLYTYLPNNTEIAVPDLASGRPQVAADGLTVTVNIKPGVHFSPPVNREVTAADVVYAFDRALNPHVATPYFRTYFGDLVGASRAHGGPFPGVTARGRYTIVFRLDRPTASTLIAALVLPVTAPVPPEFARPLDARKRTAYGSQYVVATGPYMLSSDAQGRVLGVGYRPGRFALLVRNPNWNAFTDFRPAYLDRVVIQIGGDSTAIGRAVLRGSHLVQNDPPAGAIVALAAKDFTNQMAVTPGAAVRYVALNNRRGPFANVNLRRALWAALDRQALVAATGGSLTGSVATHFIYPGTPGFDAAGGYAGPQEDYNRSVGGNLAVAAKYLKLAGYPSGRYSGPAVTVVGADGEPGSAYAAIVNRTLIGLGFRTRLLLVGPSQMLGRYCGVPAREVDVCPDVIRTRDFVDPEGLLEPAFDGASITRINNPNYGQVDDAAINREMDAAALIADPTARAQAWAQIDEQLVAQAVAVPFQFVDAPGIKSCDVAGVTQQWNDGAWDYAFTSLNAPGCQSSAGQ
jgi:peptide/nickel transport system substrate-binding protein